MDELLFSDDEQEIETCPFDEILNQDSKAHGPI